MGSKTSETILPGVSREDSAGQGLQGASDEAVCRKACRENWLAFMSQVRKDYPYCTMFGVHVAAGVITSCENIQRSLLFGGPDNALGKAGHELFDTNWEALEALCSRAWTGRLAEVKFTDGRPTSARTAEGGRRFKSLARKAPLGTGLGFRRSGAHA